MRIPPKYILKSLAFTLAVIWIMASLLFIMPHLPQKNPVQEQVTMKFWCTGPCAWDDIEAWWNEWFTSMPENHGIFEGKP